MIVGALLIFIISYCLRRILITGHFLWLYNRQQHVSVTWLLQ